MVARAAKVDRAFTVLLKSDRNKSNQDNFQLFTTPFRERFISIIENGTGPLEKEGFQFFSKWISNGLARLLVTEASPFALSFYLKKNPFHGYCAFVYPVSEDLTVELGNLRTRIIKKEEIFIYDPTRNIRIVSRKRNKVLFFLLATNYVHQRCKSFSSDLSESVLSDDTNNLNLLPAFLKMIVDNADNLDDVNIVDIAEAFCIFLKRALSFELKKNSYEALSKHDYLRACSIDYMSSNLSNPELSLKDIAQGVGISARLLSLIFEEVGTSPMKKLLDIRMEKASTELRLIENDHLSVKQIMKNNGFTSLSHFGKLFKERFKKTPKQWRAEI